MNKFDIFPKKLTLLGLLMLIVIFILLMNMISKNKAFVTSFYTHDVPGLQLYCGASRLIAINQMLESNNSNDLNAMKINQQGVLFSLDEMLKLGSEFQGEQNNLNSIDSVKKFRSNVEKNSSIVAANDLEVLKTDMQDFIERYLDKKNKLFEEQTKLSNFIALIGIVGLFLFFILIIYVYTLYKKNIVALTQMSAQIEEQRQTSVQAAKLASVGEMAAGMAHEINNPLSIISLTSKTVLKLLKKDPINLVAVKECLIDIDDTVLRISKIINGLRNISRDSNNEPMEPVLIKEIFTDVLGICTERFKNHHVTLKIEDPHHFMDNNLVCQRVQISQVLVNLLGNAFDAVQNVQEKWVLIEFSQRNKSLIISISDSGEEISDEVRQKMFLPFFTTKEVGKGTGLGLSISKGIIEAHQGNLYLDPTTSKTRFIIEFLNFF